MLREDQTCPKCGALVTPQLTRCRQCGHYLHGSQLEGLIIESLLPGTMSTAPGTSLIAIYIMLYYVLMVLLTGPEALGGFHSLALLQLGSTISTEIQDLEVWRFASSVFAHGSLLHIFFNLYALSIIGPIVERLYDRKRVITFFVTCGVISMLGSYVYYMAILGRPFFGGSVGASGAISGLLGITWWTTRNPSSEGREYNPLVTRWIVLLVLWGFLPGIDAAAHLVGLGSGILLAWFAIPGVPIRRIYHRLWTTASLIAVLIALSSTGLTLFNARGFPYQLHNDYEPRSFLFFTVKRGSPWKQSGQYEALKNCLSLVQAEGAAPGTVQNRISACERAIRVVPASPEAHVVLASLLRQVGQNTRAARQDLIGRSLAARGR